MKYEFEWNKGDFVVNSRAVEEWGTGIVTEDQRDDFVRVFFEHTSTVKRVKAGVLKRVLDPGESRTYLEHALVDEEVAAKYDIEPFPTVLKRFLENFPQGFAGSWYQEQERDYKIAAVQWASEHLSQERWRQLLYQEHYEELSQEIRRLYSKLNLLASFEMIKLNDALKIPKAQKEVGHAL